MIEKINEITEQNENVLVLAKGEHIDRYISKHKWNMGSSLDEVAQNIFTFLRRADKENVDLIIIEGVGNEGLGLAITNRLIRASAYNYIVI